MHCWVASWTTPESKVGRGPTHPLAISMQLLEEVHEGLLFTGQGDLGCTSPPFSMQEDIQMIITRLAII